MASSTSDPIPILYHVLGSGMSFSQNLKDLPQRAESLVGHWCRSIS